MNSWKIVVAALVIFAAGVITGGMTVTFRGRAARDATASTPAPAGPPAAAPGAGFPLMQRMEMLRRLDSTLNLAPAQRESIDALVRESQERVRKLWEPSRPVAQEEFRLLREKVKAVLNPEQRAQFEELMRRRLPRRNVESSRLEPSPESKR